MSSLKITLNGSNVSMDFEVLMELDRRSESLCPGMYAWLVRECYRLAEERAEQTIDFTVLVEAEMNLEAKMEEVRNAKG